MATLSGPNAGYDLNGWFIDNNFWDTTALGDGYTLTGTYNPANLTTGLKYSWNFGALPADGYYWVHVFPEVGFGQDAWSTTTLASEKPFPLAIASLSKYLVNYAVAFGGQTDGYNVSLEMYLTSTPAGGGSSITNEVMVWIHDGGWKPAGAPVGTFSDANYSAQIYSYPVYESGLHFTYTALLTNTDDPSGTIDLKAIMQKLKALGIIKGTEYISTLQLGAEVAAGTGSLTVNKLQLDIQPGGSSEMLIDGSGTTAVSAGSGSGSSSGSGAAGGSTSSPQSHGAAAGALASDFNADGRADLVWTNGSGQAVVWTMNGTSRLGASATLGTANSSIRVVTAADFDGDGKADLLLQDKSGQPLIWTMNGLTRTAAAAAGLNPGSTWRVIGAGDFNGDGEADILWQDTASNSAKIWLMNGTTVSWSTTIGNPGANWRVISAGDFDDNGKSDIVWQNTSTGQVQFWMMNGVTVTAKKTVATNPGAGWRVAGTGDVNGDGKDDLVLQNTSGAVKIWEMNGATILAGSGVGTNPGAAWKVAGVRDYNGDGKDDILFQNANGQAMVWTMNGFTVASTATLTGPGSAWHAVA